MRRCRVDLDCSRSDSLGVVFQVLFFAIWPAFMPRRKGRVSLQYLTGRAFVRIYRRSTSCVLVILEQRANAKVEPLITSAMPTNEMVRRLIPLREQEGVEAVSDKEDHRYADTFGWHRPGQDHSTALQQRL